MRFRSFGKPALAPLASLLLLSVLPTGSAFGQGGVYIDPEGVLRHGEREAGGRLAKLREGRRVAAPTGKLAEAGPMRKLSLATLQREVRKHVEAGEAVPDELRYLGGLTRVEYVFFYPNEGDVVLAGPAEPWRTNGRGDVIGVKSGLPVLQLDDLVVALRAVGPGSQARAVGCSIEPTPEGLGRLQEFLRTASAPKTNAQSRGIYNGMREKLGRHSVRVFGVPDDSHYAKVLVEADYLMKATSLGVDKPGVKGLLNCIQLTDRLSQAGAVGSSLYRFWFTPRYEPFLVSEDGLAYQIRGQGIQLLSEHEFVTATGQRQASGQPDPVASAFAKGFTDSLPDLMARRPIYAELRNAADLAIVAALIRSHMPVAEASAGDLQPGARVQASNANARVAPGNARDANTPSASGSPLSTFNPQLFAWLLDPKNYVIESYPVPKSAESLVNSQRFGSSRGGYLLGQAGGVTIEPASVLTEENLKKDDGQLAQGRGQARQASPSEWWWD